MLYYLGARPGLQVRLELRVAALARELHHDRLSVLTVNYARLGYFLSPQRVDLGSGPPCAMARIPDPQVRACYFLGYFRTRCYCTVPV